MVETALAGWASRQGVALRFIRPEARRLGVANGYADPAQLGSDRWAALVAAHALEGADVLVVNAGTALTVDALTVRGEFLGGLIVPGPSLMRRSLSQGTAGLPLVPGAYEDFPVRTADAIASGAIQACIGAIERMAAAMARRGAAPRRIILSGGAAAELRDHLPLEHSFHEHLVLDGLVLLARDP
jgi:type III pantothenate kinase